MNRMRRDDRALRRNSGTSAHDFSKSGSHQERAHRCINILLPCTFFIERFPAQPVCETWQRAGDILRSPFSSTSIMDGAITMHCDRLARIFSQRCGISADKLRPLIRPELVQSIASGHVWTAGERNSKTPLIVLSGWACEQRLLECGRRQIFSFLLSGDLLSGAKADIASLTPMLILDAADIDAAACHDPALARLLQDLMLQRTHYIYEHIVRLGTQGAVDRAYDLLSELFMRSRDCAPPLATSVAFPITQEILADMLGMSPVHVNRVLQQMRREGAITIGRGRLTVHSRDIPMRKSA